MATCGVGGGVYIYTGIMGGLMDKYYPSIKMIGVPTACYVENAKLLADKEVEGAHIAPDMAYELYEGILRFEGKGQPELRAMFPTHGNDMHLVVLKDSPYQTLADLEGKKIGTYTSGSLSYLMMKQMFETYGIYFGDNIQEIQMGVNDMVSQMKDGTIEFMHAGAGVPDARVTDLATDRQIRLLEFPEEQFLKLMEGRPKGTYVRSKIPAFSYPGVDYEVTTARFNNLMVTLASVPEDVVYNITKVVFDNIEEARGQHRFFEDTSENNLEATIPLHPGAEKYFKERGWIQ
jgi:TRAP transporter TAXI family solute receptor